jgi:hypothetical protein
MDCSDVKVGDKLIRKLGGKVGMTMLVKSVNDKTFACNALDPKLGEVGGADGEWEFDRRTGVEEDHELGWGVKFGATGSFIESKVEE